MHHDVADGYARKFMPFVLRPMLAAVQGNPQTKLRAEIQKVLSNWIFFDDVGVAAHAAVGCNDGRPGLSVVRSLEDVRLHVSKCMAVKSRIGRSSVIKSCLHPRNPRESRKVRHIADDIRP